EDKTGCTKPQSRRLRQPRIAVIGDGSDAILLDELIQDDVDVLGSDVDGGFRFAGEISWLSCGRVAVFVETDGDGYLACERSSLHHHIFGTKKKRGGKTRPLFFLTGGGGPGSPPRRSSDNEQYGLVVHIGFEFGINGDFSGNLFGRIRGCRR